MIVRGVSGYGSIALRSGTGAVIPDKTGLRQMKCIGGLPPLA
jgi:hypothetical protein